MSNDLTAQDYDSLAEFSHQIRRYLRSSERVVRNADLEPRQYEMMLALKGLPQHFRLRVGDLAEQPQIQHHSAVELIDKLEKKAWSRDSVVAKIGARCWYF